MYDHPITKKLLDDQGQTSNNMVNDNIVEDPLTQDPLEEIQYATFANRFWAHVFDSFYFTLIGLPLKLLNPEYYNHYDFSQLYDVDPISQLPILKHQPTLYESFLANAYSLGYVYGIGAICRLFWIPALQSRRKQASWGQRYFELYICTRSGQKLGYFLALGRYCLRFLSIATLIGVLFILWDKKKRALHDIICGTEVRRRPSADGPVTKISPETSPEIIEETNKTSSIVIPDKLPPEALISNLAESEQVKEPLAEEKEEAITNSKSKIRNPDIESKNIMNTYKKILGVFSSVLIIASMAYLTYLLADGGIEWLDFFLLLLPALVFIQFLIAHKFGFLYNSDSKQSFFVVSSLLSIIVLIIIPLTIYKVDFDQKKQLNLIYEQKERTKAEAASKKAERRLKLEEPIDLGKYTTVYNLSCTLKIRLIGGKIDYPKLCIRN